MLISSFGMQYSYGIKVFLQINFEGGPRMAYCHLPPPCMIVTYNLFPKGEFSLHCESPWFEWLSFPWFIGFGFLPPYDP